MAKTYRKIQAAENTMAIVEALSAANTPQTPAEIAAAVEMPENTVKCYLTTLEGQNIVEARGNRFALGMKLSLLVARQRSKLETHKREIDRYIRLLKDDGSEVCREQI